MRYAKSVLITLVAKGIALPISVLSGIITARYLGPEGRGVLTLLLALQGLAVQFGTLGFNASMTYFISRDKSLTARVLSNALVIAVAFGGVLIVGFAVAARLAPGIVLGGVDISYLDIFLITIPFAAFIQFAQNVLIAEQRIVEYNALDLLVRGLQLAGFVAVLVLAGKGTREAVMLTVGVTLLAGTIYFSRTQRIAPFGLSFDSTLFRDMFRYGVRTYLASTIMFLVFRANVFFINSQLGERAAGIYSVVLQFGDLIYLIPVTMGIILFPKVAGNAEDNGALTLKVFRFSLAFMGSVCAALAIVARPLVQLMYGEKFLEAVAPLQLMCLGILALSLLTILNNDLAARGLPSIVVYTPLVGLLITVLCNVIFLKQFGIIAASGIATISYAAMLLMLAMHAKRVFRVSWSDFFVPRRSDFSAGPA